MEPFEKPLTCKQISERTGGAISAESVRSFCHRGPRNHPLPHVRTGRSGKYIHIRPSVFDAWYEEEERRVAS
ncbi:hypothetical protein AALA69_03115 [Eggerthellaceae bacterium 24-137]